MFIYIYLPLNTSLYIRNYVGIYLSTCICIYISLYIHIFIYIYRYIYSYTMHIHICIYVRIYPYILPASPLAFAAEVKQRPQSPFAPSPRPPLPVRPQLRVPRLQQSNPVWDAPLLYWRFASGFRAHILFVFLSFRFYWPPLVHPPPRAPHPRQSNPVCDTELTLKGALCA